MRRLRLGKLVLTVTIPPLAGCTAPYQPLYPRMVEATCKTSPHVSRIIDPGWTQTDWNTCAKSVDFNEQEQAAKHRTEKQRERLAEEQMVPVALPTSEQPKEPQGTSCERFYWDQVRRSEALAPKLADYDQRRATLEADIAWARAHCGNELKSRKRIVVNETSSGEYELDERFDGFEFTMPECPKSATKEQLRAAVNLALQQATPEVVLVVDKGEEPLRQQAATLRGWIRRCDKKFDAREESKPLRQEPATDEARLTECSRESAAWASRLEVLSTLWWGARQADAAVLERTSLYEKQRWCKEHQTFPSTESDSGASSP